jgi:RimJ/RimL family protein N-acetyltransferase
MTTADRQQILITDDHEAFGARAGALLDADPVGTNVVSTVLSRVRAGLPQPAGSFWVLVEDGAGLPLGAAMCTAGFPPYLTPMPDDVATLIAGALHRGGHDLAMVRGHAGSAHAFALRWCELTGCDAVLAMAEGTHVLDRLEPPTGVSGSARTATSDDDLLLGRWLLAFEAEAEPEPGGRDTDPAAVEQRVAMFLGRVAAGLVVLWTDGGRPVSMAGWNRPVGTPGHTVGRVGPVFTPPQLRGHGYAAAATAEATRRVFDAGAQQAMLHTDLANPTSNGVYARLGYRRVGDGASWAFVPPELSIELE